MNGWVEKPLSQIADIVMGQSPDSKYYTDEEQGMPFIQGCAEFTLRYPEPKINCTQVKKVAKTGAILFSVRAPVGRINVADRDYVIGRGLAAISAKNIDSNLLEKCLVFREPEFRAASQGSTFEAINSKELSGWPIRFPEHPREQRAIAEVLSMVDRAIEKTEGLIAKQQRIKTGLMQNLLTKGIDDHGNIRSEATHAFKDSPLGRIPVEWELASLSMRTEQITKGESPSWQGFKYQPEGVLFVTSENVRNGYLDISKREKFIQPEFHKKLFRSALKKGDVLVNLVGASIARTAVYDLDYDANINQAVCCIRPSKQLNPEWLCSYLQLRENIGRLLGEQVETARANLSLGDIRGFDVAFPIIEEQDRIAAVARKHRDHVVLMSKHLEKMDLLKAALMHDLLTGERRVTQLLAQAATTQ